MNLLLYTNKLYEMDVVIIFNGLGNQMSQYAFYKAKKIKSPNCQCIFDRKSKDNHNGYELDSIFNIRIENFKSKLLELIFYYYQHSKIGFILLCKFVTFIKEPANYDYNSEYLKKHRKFGLNFYYGGWHSEKYFLDIKEELTHIFKFNLNKINKKTHEWSHIIQKDPCSISMHIRRGDYIKHPTFNNISTEKYYDNAIKYFIEKFKSPHFYVFSNDIEWCKKKYTNTNLFSFIDCNTHKDSWNDMYLMSLCIHHINANSTFSWWGAWLSKTDNGITIVPPQFINNHKVKDIYPTRWIKINNK